MPNRQQVHKACQRCRKKRAKCDGLKPCQRCDEASEQCQYSHDRWASKDELRAEIERLKKSSEGSEKSSKNFAPAENSSQPMLQEWTDGIQLHKHVMEGVVEDGDSNASRSWDANRRRLSQVESTIARSGASDTLSCFDQLLSWRSCHPTSSDRNSSLSTAGSSTSLSLPPPPLDAYTSLSDTDTWTRTGWTKAHIRHMFDVLITWDYLSFSVLGEDQFLHDYTSGSVQFCSPALVHTILALATRLVNENDDNSESLPSGWFGSQRLFDKAQALLQNNGASCSLPDIQALGFLSLYQFRCGRETEAMKFAETFSTSITELCEREPSVDQMNEEYFRVRATTYCSAVSLTRMLSLTTGRLFNMPYGILEKDSVFLDRALNTIQRVGSPVCNTAANTFNHYPYNLHVVAKIFQLTELVHTIVISTQSTPQTAPDEALAVYKKCLYWYNDLFALLGTNGVRTPFVLFTHIYYHFSLLCAFRPFINIGMAQFEFQPHEVCSQAVRSILALTQSYDDLFSLRRVSGLVPYFVCASGLFGLAVEDSGSHMDSMSLHSPQTVGLETGKHKTTTDSNFASASPSHRKVSVVAHALLLLAKMGSTHPAAALAEAMLRESTNDRR